jgi:hypothetical protein
MRGLYSGGYHHHHQPTSGSSDTDEDEVATQDETHAPTSSSYWSILTLIFFLFSVIFLGLLIYALFKYNTDAVRDACPNLLIFINIRTVIAVILFASLYTYIFCVHHGKSDHGQQYIDTYNPRIIIGFFVIYFLVFCVAGAMIIPKSMIENSECTNILEDSLFKMPLLGILGWVYIVSDGLFSIFFIVILSSMMCRSGSEHHHHNEENDGAEMPMMDA